MAQHYRCAACQEEFTQKDVEVDHIVPIGRNKSWDEFIDALFCEAENLQVLCKPDHKSKTALENKAMKEEKNESQPSNSNAGRTSKVRGRAK